MVITYYAVQYFVSILQLLSLLQFILFVLFASMIVEQILVIIISFKRQWVSSSVKYFVYVCSEYHGVKIILNK